MGVAAPAVIETLAVPNLLAMGNLISERVISLEELASVDRYTATETVQTNLVIPSPLEAELSIPAPPVPLEEPAYLFENIVAAPVTTFAAPQVFTSQAVMPQTFVQQSVMPQ